MVGQIEGQFLRGVYIKVDKEARKIADVGHALAVLSTYITHNTERRAAAIEACKKVLRGELHAPIARGLFVSAAVEARVLVAD